jgi:hypothetical protein
LLPAAAGIEVVADRRAILGHDMTETTHALAREHVPFFITPSGQTDEVLVAMAVFLVSLVVMLGVIYFRLHALPEQMSHQSNNKAQFEIVAVLALLALFSHNNLFWVAALILAMIRFPDFSTPLDSIAEAVQRLASTGPVPPFPAPIPTDSGPKVSVNAARVAPEHPADQKAV